MPPHDLRADGTTIRIREHLAGLLWMTALLQDRDGTCTLNDLRHTFTHWWPATSDASARTNFAHYLRNLINAGLLTESVTTTDRRRRTVTLTSHGTEVLHAIKEERRTTIAVVTQHLGPELTAKLVGLADQIAPILWQRMLPLREKR